MDNTVPALERALLVMSAAERSAGGISALDLVDLGIPRTTLYRILRVLTATGYLSEMPSRGESARYLLGPAIRRMAASMPLADDLAARAQPVIARLSLELNETIKVVVRDHLETVAVAVAYPGEDARVAARLGARLPLHIGAGQRLLLSRAPTEVVEQVLGRPLEKRNSETIVDTDRLRRNLAHLRKQEWTVGGLEGAPGIGSIAALIHESDHPIRAALVAVYVMSGRKRSELLRMGEALVRAAKAIGRAG